MKKWKRNNMSELNFSQRNGYSALPSQLQLGELPKKTRFRISNSISEIIERNSSTVMYGGTYLDDPIENTLKLIWIEFFELQPSKFSNETTDCQEFYEAFCIRSEINEFFDLLEILCKSSVFGILKASLNKLLKRHHTAYIFEGGIFVPISNEHAANAVTTALKNTDECGRVASNSHLKESAKNLRNGKWADSVRESIHAVESLIGKMDISSNTLGAALGEIEKAGHLHPALKNGFSSLYGYTSNEEGIRHALLDGETANVSEADALYMLGSCSSFISYLLAQSIPEKL